jgi:tetratricopeptide (TPR) repeat protein
MSPLTAADRQKKLANTFVVLLASVFVFCCLDNLPCAAAVPSSGNQQHDRETWKITSQPTLGVFNLATVKFYLGLKYYDLERWQEAICTFKEVLQIKPDCEVTYFSLGMTYSRLKIWEKALASFIKAIELKPDYVEAYLGLGMTYDMLGWDQEAVETLIMAVQIKPDYAQAHYALALSYLKQGDNKAALKEHGILKTLDPELANHLIRLMNR